MTTMDPMADPQRVYTAEERTAMNKRAHESHRKEWESDPNRTDPKHTQDRVDAAIYKYRVSIGLEKG